MIKRVVDAHVGLVLAKVVFMSEPDLLMSQQIKTDVINDFIQVRLYQHVAGERVAALP